MAAKEDNNRKYFNAVTAQRGAEIELKGWKCKKGASVREIRQWGETISEYFSTFFTTSAPVGGEKILD